MCLFFIDLFMLLSGICIFILCHFTSPKKHSFYLCLSFIGQMYVTPSNSPVTLIFGKPCPQSLHFKNILFVIIHYYSVRKTPLYLISYLSLFFRDKGIFVCLFLCLPAYIKIYPYNYLHTFIPCPGSSELYVVFFFEVW